MTNNPLTNNYNRLKKKTSSSRAATVRKRKIEKDCPNNVDVHKIGGKEVNQSRQGNPRGRGTDH